MLPPPESWGRCRVAVVVAHPDDEVLGCGALLATLRDLLVVHVTDGAPRDGADAAWHGFPDPASYAAARRMEALDALALAGVAPDRLLGLDIPDQAAVGVLPDLARRLANELAGRDVVLTHAFEGGHPDHDAVAFAVRAACDRLGDDGPAVVEMPFYFGDEAGWVRQRFLPHPEAGPEMAGDLSADDRALKARMVAAHATQRDTLASFPLDAERFRRAPAYDFTQRPHPGPLLYERHGWGLTWAGWVDRVAAARAALGGVVA